MTDDATFERRPVELHKVNADAAALIIELFEHCYFVQGYLLGTIVRAGKSSAEALDETKYMRHTVRLLAERAGLPIPTYFEHERGDGGDT